MISIVLPFFNEQESIPELYDRITRIAADFGDEVEFIAVDDGSTDSTPGMLQAICDADHRWRLLRFSRNFGHQAAVSAGIYYSGGDVVAVMDSDLQDPPELLPSLLEQWRNGYQVVYAVRTKRKEPWWKRCAYFCFYRILRMVSTIEIPLDTGDFCVMDRSVVRVLRGMPERVRFVRGLRSWAGFRQSGLTYEREVRKAGQAKYSLRSLFRLAMNGILSFSSAPLRLASYLGFLFCGVSILLILFLLLWRTLDFDILGARPGNSVGWTSLFSLILFLSGLQMLVIGAIGEYLARVFDEVQNRPPWIIGFAHGIQPVEKMPQTGWFVTESFRPHKVDWLPPPINQGHSFPVKSEHATVI